VVLVAALAGLSFVQLAVSLRDKMPRLTTQTVVSTPV
jgi:hypothetical protein